MIDWHSHILPGLDDGADSLDESVALGHLLVQVGFTEVHCTPHCLRGMYDNRPADVRAACADLQAHFDREKISLKLHPGMEYCLDEYFPENVDGLLPLGDSNFVLVETPSRATIQQLKENVFLVKREGFEPLFAHPERHAFLAPPKQLGTQLLSAMLNRMRGEESVEPIDETPLEELIKMGCRFQCNLGSVGGYYGRLVQKQVRRFLDLGLYHCIGSDVHHIKSSADFLAPAIEEIGDRSAGLLTANY